MFTVDAYPGRRYPARVMRVGFGSQIKDNVVTYPTLLTVNNDDLSLRPGMTATAEITAVTRDDVLLVPNAALRFTPAAGDRQPAKSSAGGLRLEADAAAAARRAEDGPRQDNRAREQHVWVLQDGAAGRADAITVGVTDGRDDRGDGRRRSQPGMAVITGADCRNRQVSAGPQPSDVRR